MSADVYWIKLLTSTFDVETIMLLESMPEGDTILIIWLKMQILAGKCNAGGYLLLNGDIPYSDEMLATVFRRSLNTVRLAISAFLKFQMVEIVDGAYYLPDWEKHQNVSGLDKIREQTRQRVARHRAKAKSVTLPVTHSNASETETKIEQEKQQQGIRLLLMNSPFSRITDQELHSLAERHGFDKLKLAADVAAETWRREKDEIRNTGGYLNSLCSSLIIPQWYKSPKDRKAEAEAVEKKRQASKMAEKEKKAREEKESLARDAYWSSIPEIDQEKFRLIAKKSLNPGLHIPEVAIASMAKSLAWEGRAQDG